MRGIGLALILGLACAALPASAAECSVTSIGQAALDDLGQATYLGRQGGLYPQGVNTRPTAHDVALDRVGRPLRLAADGTPDAQDGVIVLMSVGMSNTTQEFQAFKQIADADPRKFAGLVIVDAAQGGQAAEDIDDPLAEYWNRADQRLAAQGVTPLQVQAIWLKQARRGPDEPFPEDAELLQEHLQAIVGIIAERYPNTRAVYLSSRIYAGYASTSLNPEPYAFQSGFAVKWLVEAQLAGDPLLNFDPGRGAVRAPWLAWGPYLWADGLIPRGDGLVWRCEDFANDGTHPSASGRQKVADRLLTFFTQDPTAVPWFVDCDPSRPGTFASPPPVLGLALQRLGSGDVELSWDDLDPVAGADTVYDVVSGRLDELRASRSFAASVCLANALPQGPFLDLRPDPLPDWGEWFLVRGRNACGAGSWGASRSPTACP